MKRILAVIGIIILGVLMMGTKPEGHQVTICHATPPDSASNGWHEITVDIASIGYQQSGHQDQHNADIIPAYNYSDGFSFGGKNMGTNFDGHTGAEILANGCKLPQDPTIPYITDMPTPTPTMTLTPKHKITRTPTEPFITITPSPFCSVCKVSDNLTLVGNTCLTNIYRFTDQGHTCYMAEDINGSTLSIWCTP